MNTNLLKKWLAIGIILLFVGLTIAPTIAQNTEKSQSTSRGNWLYVGGSGPGNYSKIQDAIDNASDGDTVFVYDDSSPYYEHVSINKSLKLLGEDKNTTIIDASGIQDVINIVSDNVLVCGFTLQNSGNNTLYYISDSSVDLRANNSKITNNIVKSNQGFGVALHWANNNSIENNLLEDNVYTGIEISHYSNNNIIANNTINHSDNGISLFLKCKYNIVKDNTAQNCELCGINFYWDCDENIITRNLLFNNHDYGIWFYDSNNNSIYHNDLIRNNRNAKDKDGINNWDNGYPSGGNYWDDYTGKDNYSGVSQNESGPDGIGDTSYNISDGNNQDQYPLMIPYGWTTLAIQIHSISPRLSMSIKNVGNISAVNVQWSIIIKGGFILIGRNSSGERLQPLPPEQEIMVKSRFFLGLGKIEITFTAWADNAPIVSARINGIILLFFFRPIEM